MSTGAGTVRARGAGATIVKSHQNFSVSAATYSKPLRLRANARTCSRPRKGAPSPRESPMRKRVPRTRVAPRHPTSVRPQPPSARPQPRTTRSRAKSMAAESVMSD